MANPDAPVTFEEAEEEVREKIEEAGEEPDYAGESPVVPTEEDLEEVTDRLSTFLATSPERLSRRRGRTKVPKDSGGIQQNLIDLTVEAGNVEAQLEEAASQTDFLQNIAQSNLAILQNIQVLADTQVQMLDTTFEISDYLAPFSQVTVSGTNEIDDPDTAEVVVPDSDNIDIPTRVLFIKASENNDNPIAIGDDDTEPTNGWILHPNEYISLNINLVDEVLFMASEESGEVVELLGLV